MKRLVSLIVVLALTAAACGDSATDSTTSTTVDLAPTATEILANAAVTMQQVETLAFTIDLSGAPITLLGVELRGAVGEYAAPDSSRAVLEAGIGGLTIELGTIAIGDVSWVTNPLTGKWDEYTGSRAFNPSIIFDPDLGWLPLLTTDISDARLVEPADGDSHIIRGTAAGARVEVLTAGLVESQPVALELHIARDTGHVTLMDFETEGDNGRTRWLLQLSDFGKEVSISPPEVG
ncbi:MAG: LppX_LprAFG lipoprotein [Acidimicrobiia bacterium]